MSYTPPPPPPDEGGPGDGSGEIPPGYGTPPPPGYGTPPPEDAYGAPRNSSKAVVSLVIGIISPVLGLCCAFLGLIGIVAVVIGKQAQREIAASNGMLVGAGMAKAGVVLGIIGAAIGALLTILNIVLLMTGDGSFNYGG